MDYASPYEFCFLRAVHVLSLGHLGLRPSGGEIWVTRREHLQARRWTEAPWVTQDHLLITGSYDGDGWADGRQPPCPSV